MSTSSVHLPAALAIAVPHEIQRMQVNGGPSARDVAALDRQDDKPSLAIELATRGEVLLFPDASRHGEPSALFTDVAHALAVLAFLPGGVTLFGSHREAGV